MALFALLLIAVAIAGLGGFVLVRRRRALDAASVAKALTAAAARLAAGQPEQARRRYARLTERLALAPPPLRPQRGTALIGLARATEALGDPAAALGFCREAFPLVPAPDTQIPRWGLQRLAEVEIRADRPDLALVLAFLRAADRGPEPGEDPDAAGRVLDWLQRRCREGTAAERDSATAAALKGLPGRDWPVLARSALLRAGGRPGEAEAVLAAAAPGGSGELWFRHGAHLHAAGRNAEAVEAFGRAVERGTGEPSPWARGAALRAESLLFRGLARQFLGDHPGAAADLADAAAAAPDDPRPRYALGRLALVLDRDDEAHGHFAAALAAQPGHTPSRLGLALLHERAGRPAEAAADYRTALDAGPHWQPAKVRLGAALLAAGRTEEAVSLLHAEAEAGHPWSPSAAFHHGLALARGGDPEGAVARWEPLGDPDLSALLTVQRDLLARRLLDTDPGAARALWQRTVLDTPDEPGLRGSLREAALREAAHLLLTRRDDPEALDAAAEALALAGSRPALPDGPAASAREGRLRAALALARGSASGPDALPADADGPRDRYHRAAAGLLTGRPVRTVAPVEPDPQGDPALARLRALLAERAGNRTGALDWHRRHLANPAAPAPAPDGGAPCTAADGARCDRAATDACGSCGREGCTTHLHRPEGGSSARCGRCAEQALLAVLDCALQADLPEEAERTLAAWAAVLGDSPAGITVRAALCLLRADDDDLDAVLADLPAAAHRARTTVLVRRAARAVGARRFGDAAGDLREAVRLTPDHALAAEALGVLAEHEAARHAAEGRYQEAWDCYRALLLRDPSHPRLLHALGLVSYRLAAAVPAQGAPARGRPAHGIPAQGGARDTAEADGGADGGAADGETADGGVPGTADGEDLWHWAIGCLVPSLHLPDVWEAAAGVTGREAEPPRVAAARAALTDRLRTDLRTLDQAHGRTGDEVDAWTVRLGMEVRCAEAFAEDEVLIARPDGTSHRLVVGPALERLLRTSPPTGELSSWQGAFQYAVLPWRKPGPYGVHPLTHALGLFEDLGPQRYLLLQGRHAAAVTALESADGTESDETRRHLLREALTSQAAEHHRHQEWREALECLTRARTLPGAELGPELAALGADAGLRAARALLKEHDDDQAGAAALLEQALALSPGHREVGENLGAAYAQHARKINNETRDYRQALVLLRKALALAPDDPTARHFLEAALRNRANEVSVLGPDGDLIEATGLWQELTELDDDPDHRSGLVYVLQLRSLTAALDDRRTEAVACMADALEADGEFTGDPNAEAPRRVSVVLANHVLEKYQDRPFDERASLLRRAQTYDDSADMRAVIVNVWRSEAARTYEADRFADATVLLEQALQMAGRAETKADIRKELGVVLGAHAVRSANARRFQEARTLIGKAVTHDPNDTGLRSLKYRIDRLR
jgi:tetratricopeptide (TPR) repeat protein